MLISVAWLRELVPVRDDAATIARRLTARGLTVDAVGEAGGDSVLDIDVPANRPDALGHRGVAREVAAAFGLKLSPGPQASAGEGRPVSETVRVAIEAPDLCGRYTARCVRGVRIGPSPGWVVARLAACGLRSINNVVDVSNLVMLEWGQPVHFFDLATIAGAEIHVRRAFAGERMTTLDGIERLLPGDALVIADRDRGVGLGGIIGGAETEIRDTTTDVLIEAAWFAPAGVRKTARALGITTDASQRFGRGCDPEAPPAAQATAVALLEQLAGGRAAPGMIDVHPAPSEARRLSVRIARAARLLGYTPSLDEAVAALAAVGLAPSPHADRIDVIVPSWRVDLEREADVVEEIGRHLGYDRIPERAPGGAPRRASSAAELDERVRDRFAALGFAEAFNYAMIAAGEDAPFVAGGTPDAIPLDNPIAEPLAVLRRAIVPGLIRSVDQNLRRGAADVRLFEVGHVFHARGTGVLPHEPLRAAFAWAGSAEPAHWSAPSREVDAFDAAGIVEEVLRAASGDRPFAKRPASLPGLHPGRATAWVSDDGRLLAWAGPVHPELAARLDLPATIHLGEVDLDLAASRHAEPVRFRPIPRVPAVARDLSIVLDEGAAAESVRERLASIPSPAPASLAWRDRYAGSPLASGQAAMTLRVILQPLERTLTDAEVEEYRGRLVAALDAMPDARLRRIDT